MQNSILLHTDLGKVLVIESHQEDRVKSATLYEGDTVLIKISLRNTIPYYVKILGTPHSSLIKPIIDVFSKTLMEALQLENLPILDLMHKEAPGLNVDMFRDAFIIQHAENAYDSRKP